MMTLGALAEPGAEAKMWLYFAATILLTFIGIVLFILSFRRKEAPFPNQTDVS